MHLCIITITSFRFAHFVRVEVNFIPQEKFVLVTKGAVQTKNKHKIHKVKANAGIPCPSKDS